MMRKKRKIYIILSYSGTMLSRIIRVYTKAEYSHVSIALDEDLDQMYSFGRLHSYNPFIGGFVHEGISFGTFKRFKNTKALIYSLELTERQYKKLKCVIKKMNRKKQLYRFNTIGLFAAGFNIRVKRENYFYCAEFVKYLLDKAAIDLDLPEVIKPIDFKDKNCLEMEYIGILRNYKVLNNSNGV